MDFLPLLLIAIAAIILYSVSSIRYRITPEELQIIILGIALRKVRLNNIESVQKGRDSSFWNIFTGENWANFHMRNVVTIKRKSGLMKNLIITPTDPDKFISTLQQAILQKGGFLERGF